MTELFGLKLEVVSQLENCYLIVDTADHQRPHVVKVFFKEFGKDLTSSTTY
jgi:hypothetical protein